MTALGAKQKGLTFVHFLNKLIVSCKEAVRFPFYFFLGEGVFFILDSYFLVGCRIIVYVLSGAVPSNVKRMSLIFKISKINLEYFAIFLFYTG
jgi:hypothetical protein